MFTTILNKKQTRWALFLEKYNFKIKYKTNSLNLANRFSKRLNYKNESLNDTCFFTLQNKLQNITIAKIELLNDDINSDFEKKNLNNIEFKKHSNSKKTKIVEQKMCKINANETCAKKFVYKNSFKKLLSKIKKIQFLNKYC